MKKLYFLLLSLLISATSFGQILSEDFDYGSTAGDLTAVSTGVWANHSGSGAVAYATTSLSMTGYPNTGVGGSATIVGSAGEDVNRGFAAISSGTAYASALVSISAVGSGNYFMHFNSTNFRARVGAKDNGSGKILFGIGTSSSTLTYGTTPFDLDTTYLLVFSYEVSSGISKLYVLTTPEATEPTTPEATNTGTADTSISAISFRQSSNIPTTTIDGVRVANNWTEIMNNSTTSTITVGSAVSGLNYFEGNGPSNEGSFTVSGVNLTADISVTAPTNFELSLTSGGTFTPNITLTQTAGAVATTTVYVRLATGLTSNSYSGDATASSTGATDKTVALSGTVSPAVPQMTITGFVGSLHYALGAGPSNEDSFNVQGLFLTENILVTAPANFEVSLTTGAGFASSVSVPFGSGTVASTEIFIRLVSGLAVGPYSGNVTASSAGATNQTIAVSGNVNPAATCSNVGDIIITEIMQNPSASGNDPAGEYFELYNTTGASIDMAGWIIKDEASTSESHTITSSLIVPAGGYIVIGNVATTTPVLNYNYANDISLGNGTDGLIIECSATTIDAVTWDDGSTFPDPTGKSMELSITALNSTDNDTGTNWGVATADIGNGDLGTPGAVNSFTTLSVNQIDATSFNVYPNPTNISFINITSASNDLLQAKVFDILGKQVIESNVVNNQLNVSSLNAGVYILKLTQNNASVTKKLVIK